MNIPNFLTIIRLFLVPVFVMVFFSGTQNATIISVSIFLAAGFTDVLDGYIARKYNMVTKWGTVLDPFADKLMSITVLISFAIKNIIPAWVLYVIGIKELLMIIGGAVLFKKGTCVPAKIYGKITTVLFYISIFVLEFVNNEVGLALIYMTMISTIFSFFKYLGSIVKMRNI
jgi:cardiolipin synthase